MRLAHALLLGLCSTFVVMGLGLPRSAASEQGDKQKVAELEQTIENDGEKVQSLVSKYNHSEGVLQSIEQKIAKAKSELVTDHKVEVHAERQLRVSAIDAYIAAVSGSAITALSSVSSSSLPEQRVYLRVASGSLSSAEAAMTRAEHATSVTESALSKERQQTESTLSELASEKSAVDAEINTAESSLSGVKANLVALAAAAAARKEQAEEQEEEEALAAAAQQSAPNPSPAAAVSSLNPSPGSYANPLRSVAALDPERIDQGVDYSGYGPIYAIGDGVVLSTFNFGWPGGTFITYRLSDGRAAGLVVYAAEDINPEVHVGEDVTNRTVLGQIYEGPDGIETGWSDPSGDGNTMAMDFGQFSGANSTAFGDNFSQLLSSLGAPGGILQNSPPSGSLPNGWPQW